MKKLNKLIRRTQKLYFKKRFIFPTKVFYIWNKTSLTKVETFSL
jgi:hypothetical protein